MIFERGERFGIVPELLYAAILVEAGGLELLIVAFHVLQQLFAEAVFDRVEMRFEARDFFGEACADGVEELAPTWNSSSVAAARRKASSAMPYFSSSARTASRSRRQFS